MDSKLIPAIIAFALVVFVVGIFVPADRDSSPEDLPWRVSASAGGGSRVFGIDLGQTTLAQARERLGDEPTVTLFSDPDAGYSVEAYYDSIEMAGLHARMVLNIGVPKGRVQEMYRRGLRISRAESGARKVSLAPEDLEQVMAAPVEAVTYLPKVDIPEEVLANRFGEPERQVKEPDGGPVHWLYPAKGLDIVFNADGKELFQYVRPDRFEETVVQPLERLERSDPVTAIGTGTV